MCLNHSLYIKYFIIYSLLVWRHSLFQLSITLIQTITAFIGVILITDAFSHNTDTLQLIGYSWNYALKLALLSHTNTQSPDVAECSWSLLLPELLSLPECLYKPVSLIHTWYTSALQVSAQQCWVSQRTAAHCWE